MNMDALISVIIPNRNNSATIGRCLKALFASHHDRFEVIVVDDCSDDDSTGIIRAFPCNLVRLRTHQGAAHARNMGALHSRGRILFFIDADCLVQKGTLARVEQAALLAGPHAVLGGTYTALPADQDFFSAFQSAFIRYFETKRPADPDYIASHAMAVHAETFRKSGGFPRQLLPMIEDVHFSHTLRKAGYRLLMDPAIEVTHIFNFSLQRSLRNALRKSFYWTIYSLGNQDLFADSGTASRELKVNVASWFIAAGALAAGILLSVPVLPAFASAMVLENVLVNRKLLQAYWRAGGSRFALKAAAYYLLVYPMAVGAGAAGGMLSYALERVRSANRPTPSHPREA
jgi:glycosyltransferase involved in cell wall biosynthesis